MLGCLLTSKLGGKDGLAGLASLWGMWLDLLSGETLTLVTYSKENSTGFFLESQGLIPVF